MLIDQEDFIEYVKGVWVLRRIFWQREREEVSAGWRKLH